MLRCLLVRGTTLPQGGHALPVYGSDERPKIVARGPCPCLQRLERMASFDDELIVRDLPPRW